MSIKIKRLLFMILFILFWVTGAYSDEGRFEEGKVLMDLPKAWTFKTVEQKTDSGQLIVRRWVREAIKYKNIDFYPGIAARAIPLEQFQIKDPDWQLVLISGIVLGQSPYNIQLHEVKCLKCVEYEGRDETGDYTAISDSIPPDCDKKSEKKADSACTYETINRYGFTLEPSWILGFQKDANGSMLDVVLIQAIHDGKLIEISFWYPAALSDTLDPEVTKIINSISLY
ncbi:MAG: hypothetical protein JW944_10420 [Deltaproteobacteria bacterium]|nr:hypothetical protein [Deltaproteobacteria bacterium]